MNYKHLEKMTEKELKDHKLAWPKTKSELKSLMTVLEKRQHDYGTCVYAMSLAALGAFYYMSSKLGVTGFQASCADMDFISRTRNYEHGFAIINYNDVLYPQLNNTDHFPTAETILAKQPEYFQKAAEELLKDSEFMAPEVKKHLEHIAGV